MSLIEVLIALGMVGLLSAVIASVLQTMQKGQNQSNTINTIETLRMTVEKSILDSASWTKTITDTYNSDFTCVNPATMGLCTPTAVIPPNVTDADILGYPTPGTILRINRLRDGSDSIVVNNMTADAGFDAKGAVCTGWTAAGNDACPIRIELRARFICPTAAACLSPNVEAFAVFQFAPDPNSSMKSVVNTMKYRVRVIRGTGANFISEKFIAYKVLTAAGTGGGVCPVGAWTPISNLTIRAGDNAITPAGSATIAGPNINFPVGTYTCNAMVTCFHCGTLKGRLLIAGSGTTLGDSPAVLVPKYTVGQASIPSITFTLSGAGTLQLQQICTESDAVSTDPLYPTNTFSIYGLGMALPDYSETIISSLSCVKTF